MFYNTQGLLTNNLIESYTNENIDTSNTNNENVEINIDDLISNEISSLKLNKDSYTENINIDLNKNESKININEIILNSNETTSSEVITNEVITNEVITNEVSTNESTTNEVSTNEVTTNEASQNEPSQNEVSQNEVDQNEVPPIETTQNKNSSFCIIL